MTRSSDPRHNRFRQLKSKRSVHSNCFNWEQVRVINQYHVFWKVSGVSGLEQFGDSSPRTTEDLIVRGVQGGAAALAMAIIMVNYGRARQKSIILICWKKSQ